MDINHTDLEKLLKEDLDSCKKEHNLLQIKSKYLGKKGYLTLLFASLKNIDSNKRKTLGAELNSIKNILSSMIEIKLVSLRSSREVPEKIDLDVPARHHNTGSHHPISLIIKKIENIFFRVWI